MKSIEQMLTLHSYQGCSDVRDRCYIVHGFCFITISTLSYSEAPPTLSETIFKEQKENPSIQEHLLSIQLFCFMIFLETWSFDLKVKSMLGAQR